DFTVRAAVNARVVRITPVNEIETHLAVDFINLSRTQTDDLALVMYSDVKEWYSQKRENADKPIASLGFLASSITRSLRELKPTNTKKIRKEVNTKAQLYWDGHFFSGVATELGITGLRLELDSKKAISNNDRLLGKQDLEKMRSMKPLVGLLLSPKGENTSPTRFVAEISVVEEERGKVSIELNFPEKFSNRQSPKIKQLLRNNLGDDYDRNSIAA
ncbi:MAG: cellulose synthase, partial [Rivularia sp. (in: cyanobacteria)]